MTMYTIALCTETALRTTEDEACAARTLLSYAQTYESASAREAAHRARAAAARFLEFASLSAKRAADYAAEARRNGVQPEAVAQADRAAQEAAAVVARTAALF